jgi:hypothetical protein
MLVRKKCLSRNSFISILGIYFAETVAVLCINMLTLWIDFMIFNEMCQWPCMIIKKRCGRNLILPLFEPHTPWIEIWNLASVITFVLHYIRSNQLHIFADGEFSVTDEMLSLTSEAKRCFIQDCNQQYVAMLMWGNVLQWRCVTTLPNPRSAMSLKRFLFGYPACLLHSLKLCSHFAVSNYFWVCFHVASHQYSQQTFHRLLDSCFNFVNFSYPR